VVALSLLPGRINDGIGYAELRFWIFGEPAASRQDCLLPMFSFMTDTADLNAARQLAMLACCAPV
jgi:hypothetical protein